MFTWLSGCACRQPGSELQTGPAVPAVRDGGAGGTSSKFARCHIFGEPCFSANAASLAASYNPDLPYQPFEMVVLEAALKEVCQSYGTKAKQLEAIINPACDALLKKVREGELLVSMCFSTPQSQAAGGHHQPRLRHAP